MRRKCRSRSPRLPETCSGRQAGAFSVKLTRETRATRAMMFLWTGEVVADGRGFRVLGTGSPRHVCGSGIDGGKFPGRSEHPLDGIERERQGVRGGPRVPAQSK